VIPQNKTRGQRKTQAPCSGCFLHKDRCLCDEIPCLDLNSKLTLIIHTRELKRTTNTGQLALRALKNSDHYVRGLIDEPLNFTQILDPEYQSVLFFPAEDASLLTPEWASQWKKPIQLLVPDGNWRQASKVFLRHPEVKILPRVMVKPTTLQTHFLRKETKPEGLSTLQAIALAFGALEGPDVEKKLMTLYELKLQRTLEGRGVFHLPH